MPLIHFFPNDNFLRMSLSGLGTAAPTAGRSADCQTYQHKKIHLVIIHHCHPTVVDQPPTSITLFLNKLQGWKPLENDFGNADHSSIECRDDCYWLLFQQCSRLHPSWVNSTLASYLWHHSPSFAIQNHPTNPQHGQKFGQRISIQATVSLPVIKGTTGSNPPLKEQQPLQLLPPATSTVCRKIFKRGFSW